ncbi:unnamed protein product [Thelazia callipaeda]|uniref:Ovule protein n=1 Tax=Thelazia callipaeda TaxID=103827 RepID=A0A0N5D1X1_THECL|nr:unnamed protein product [Thelazia callipaeda]
MKSFWNWILDQKMSTTRKWQSAMLRTDGYHPGGTGQMKLIGGSDDELERKQRQNSSAAQTIRGNHKISFSLQNFDNVGESKSIDFDEFFDESSNAIESALVSLLVCQHK